MHNETCMTYTISVCTVQTPDDGQRSCPKHVEFYSKNTFEKLGHIIVFIIRIFHDARSDINHCCVYSERLLMMDRGTVRNM